MTPAAVVQGQLIAGRYYLDRPLGGDAAAEQGVLWLAQDQLAAGSPVALRQVGDGLEAAAVRERWQRLQGVLHPQLPRLGPALEDDGRLWLVREWVAGRTLAQLREARRERQLVFGAGEVLLLLRQLLPLLAALHSQGLVHGDLSPANILRRDSDGQPVLLDFALLQVAGGAGPRAVTPGYAPPALVRGEPPAAWMDLHALAVVALVLLSGDDPAALLDPLTLAWRWPVALEEQPGLSRLLQRCLSDDPARRFAAATEALQAAQALAMPDSTGPVPRADRTVVLVPSADSAAAAETPAPAAEAVSQAVASQIALSEQTRLSDQANLSEQTALSDSSGEPMELSDSEASPGAAGVSPPTTAVALSPRRRRQAEREAEAEGVWPVLIALVLSAIVGTALGWWWMGRSRPQGPGIEATAGLTGSLPSSEVDQRQQLLARLRAMQVDRGWFLRLVDASLLAQYPERGGRLPGDGPADAPLRRVWNELAEDWLSRVEQLPMELRQRLGSFSDADWTRRQAGLVGQGLSSAVLAQLVSGSAQNLLPGRNAQRIPAEPFRQLWYAAAEQTLRTVRIEPITVPPRLTQMITAEVEASGARLFPIRLPAGYGLVLGANGTPLLQMSVFAADGSVLDSRGPLRVVNLGYQKASPVQLLVTNDGVAPAMIRLSLRADPPLPVQAPTPPEGVDPPELPNPAPAAASDAGGTPAPVAPVPAAPAAPTP